MCQQGFLLNMPKQLSEKQKPSGGTTEIIPFENPVIPPTPPRRPFLHPIYLTCTVFPHVHTLFANTI